MISAIRFIRFLRIGVGISDTDVEYADSASNTVAPTTGWQTEAPKWQNGHYIWSRTHIYYTNGTEKITKPVCLGSGTSKVAERILYLDVLVHLLYGWHDDTDKTRLYYWSTGTTRSAG